MHEDRHAIFAALLSTSALFAAEPPIEFSGVLTTNGAVRLAPDDKATNATRWLARARTSSGIQLSVTTRRSPP